VRGLSKPNVSLHTRSNYAFLVRFSCLKDSRLFTGLLMLRLSQRIKNSAMCPYRFVRKFSERTLRKNIFIITNWPHFLEEKAKVPRRRGVLSSWIPQHWISCLRLRGKNAQAFSYPLCKMNLFVRTK